MVKKIITTNNSKLGTQIPSINMPVSICGVDVPCKSGCYARKGNFTFTKVKRGLNERLEWFLKDADSFFNEIIKELSGLVIYRFVRWHSSGDIVNMKYFYGMIKVAKKCPKVTFLCFTKKFDIVNAYLSLGHKLPKNLKIVFSGWDKNFKFENPYNLPTTYVKFKDNQLNVNFPNDAFICPGACETCLKCWKLKEKEVVVFNKH